MPRPKSYTREDLADRALTQFWQNGFYATSMDELVAATRVSRHGIYKDFGDKKTLYLACFDRYQTIVVTPAFAQVEANGAALPEIAAYFEAQIALAESTGLPSVGCFVGNSITEVAPHDPDVRICTDAHNQRLARGFLNALGNAFPDMSQASCKRLADMIVVFATGLWAISRSTEDAEFLRTTTAMFLSTLEGYAS